jgi:hypothetical protein
MIWRVIRRREAAFGDATFGSARSRHGFHLCHGSAARGPGHDRARFPPDWRDGGLSNPDSYMLLVRLRDMMRGGVVLDSVARDGSGHGTVLHWSHLLDSMLLLLAAPFRLFLGADDALHAAALAFGPLNIAGLGLARVWAARLIAGHAPPRAGIGATEVDRLSLLFAGLALAVACAGIGAWAVHRMVPARVPRIAAAGAIGLICCAVWAVCCHDAIVRAARLFGAAPGDMMLVGDAMFVYVNEMLPVGGVFGVVQFLLTGICATLVAIAAAMGRRSPLLGYAAVCLACLLVLGQWHVRFAAYPEAAAAVAVPITLTIAARVTAGWHPIGRSFARMATILLFVQVPFMGQAPFPGQLPEVIGPEVIGPEVIGSVRAAPIVVVPECAVADAVAMLEPHPGAVVLAAVNDTPELLYKTRIRTAGSLYHRGIDGFPRLRDAWRSGLSATVPPEIDAAEVELVLGCLSPARSPLVADLLPMATLLDQLRTGQPPPWLRPIDANSASGQVLYEVSRTNGGGVHAAAN